MALVGVLALQFWQMREAREAQSVASQSPHQGVSAIESKIQGYIDAAIAREREWGDKQLTEEKLTAGILERLEALIEEGALSLDQGASLVSLPANDSGAAEAQGAPMTTAAGSEFAAIEPSPASKLRREGKTELQQIHFLFDSADLTPGARRNTQAAADLIKQAAPQRVKVIGFADTLGSETYNDQLSYGRAQSVAEVLIESGVSRDSIEVSSLGESKLPAATLDNVAEPLNRCVSIRIIH
jgi:outer membrane protein OmpA-like peptidoglycan-associated protein